MKEDLLSFFNKAYQFIESGLGNDSVLVHWYKHVNNIEVKLNIYHLKNYINLATKEFLEVQLSLSVTWWKNVNYLLRMPLKGI